MLKQRTLTALVLAPIASIRGLRMARGDLLRGFQPPGARIDLLAERVSFALALRDLSRRRVGVAIGVDAGAGRTRVLTGTLDRVAASIVGAAVGAMLWATTFAALRMDDRLAWNPSLWAGTVTLSALFGAVTAAVVALPAPTGHSLVDGLSGPQPA